jgi:hypothetical protein
VSPDEKASIGGNKAQHVGVQFHEHSGLFLVALRRLPFE